MCQKSPARDPEYRKRPQKPHRGDEIGGKGWPRMDREDAPGGGGGAWRTPSSPARRRGRIGKSAGPPSNGLGVGQGRNAGGAPRSPRVGKRRRRWSSRHVVVPAALALALLQAYLLARSLSLRSSVRRNGGSGSIGGGMKTKGGAPAAMSLEEARARPLTPLRVPVDYEHYTIRMNTFRRDEQLMISLDHHAECRGVAMIQVVWCDPDRDPPPGVEDHPSGKVVVERHDLNSLNERFRVLSEPPTVGILSMDDDVLRPCEAIDSGFFTWVRSPDRMVGYDSRVHVEDADGWKYGPLSVTKEMNSYSIALTRYGFLHRDYLDLYFEAVPPPILDFVADNLNCEDIAMSLFVSSLTGGEPPLLAQWWASKAQVKLFHTNGISTGIEGHRNVRDECVDGIATLLGLKGGSGEGATEGGGDGVALRRAALFPSSDDPHPHYGAVPDERRHRLPEGLVIEREVELREMISGWMESGDPRGSWNRLLLDARRTARERGLIEKTEEWRRRWGDAVLPENMHKQKRQDRAMIRGGDR